MLYVFVRDMWDVLRLRYRSPETYLYSPLVMAAVLLLLGVVNAASMSPLFGSGAAAVCLSVILVIVKWLVLSRSMRKVLHYYGAPRLPLWGFILVSEALLLPLLLVLYVPALAAFALLWQAWVFVVQVRGLMWMGNATVGRVLVGYLLYGFGVLCVGTVILMLFIAAGWLDMETLNQNLQALTSARQ